MPLTAKINEIIIASNFELIRDRIAEILMVELANQSAMSYIDYLDADVYVERFIPADPAELVNRSMIIVSVSEGNHDNHDYTAFRGNVTYTIDVFTSSNTTNEEGGDQASTKRLEKLLGICSKILNSPIYKTLAFETSMIYRSKTVGFQIGQPKTPEQDSIAMGRLNLMVLCNENLNLSDSIPLTGSDTQIKINQTQKGYLYILNP